MQHWLAELPSSRRVTPLLWPTGAVLGLAAEWVAYRFDDPIRWLPDLLVGWTLIACGLIGAARRPESRSGALMVATGFTWFLGNFANAEIGPVAWAGLHGIYLHRGPLVHLILAYPSGRLSSRSARVAAGAGYLAALVPPVWDSEVATILLSGLLVVASAREYLRAVGRHRRARFLPVLAAVGCGLVLTGGAWARLALRVGDVSGPSLLAYEGMLCVIAIGLLAGLLWAPWERADVTDLVVELGAAQSGTLRAALSRALGDPSLEVGYWIAERQSFVDAEGRVLELPHPASERSVTRVDRDGAPVAVIVHDPAVLDDPALRKGVASAARLAVSNARLQAEVQARVVDIEASRRRLLEARDDERRRLERRLRHGAEHRLDSLRGTVRRARQSASGSDRAEQLFRVEEQLGRTLEDLRRLAQGLHPRVLSDHGLERALTSMTEGLPIPVELEVAADPMPAPAETAAYFVCAEALANVVKYASASRVTMTVTREAAAVKVIVEDDGVGGADPSRGSGLRGISDRIGALGGWFSVESPRGRGTRLTAEIPLGGEGNSQGLSRSSSRAWKSR